MTSVPADSRPVRYSELVRSNADFRWLWFGQIVSLLGDWFNMIASVALLAALTNTGFAVGGLFVVRMLAPFLTSPLAGVAADRYDRRRILIAADIVRGFIVLGMLFVRSPQTAWLLYVLTALQLGTSSFFFTARNAILPDIVSPRGLGTANAIGSVTWSVMLAVGAGLGGITAGSLGVYTAFSIDAATFFVSALLVARIRRSVHVGPGGRVTLADALREYLDGLRFLAHHRDILAIALHKPALTMLLGTTFRVVQITIAKNHFPVGRQAAVSMGLFMAIAGIGTGVGPLLARRFTHDYDRRLRWAIVAGYFIGATGLLTSATLANFPVVLLGAFLAGMGNGILWVFSTQLLLQHTPSTIRGRVFGTEFAMFALASSIGSATIGYAIDTRVGVTGALWSMAALTLLPAIAWIVWIQALPAQDSKQGQERLDAQ